MLKDKPNIVEIKNVSALFCYSCAQTIQATRDHSFKTFKKAYGLIKYYGMRLSLSTLIRKLP